MPCHHLEYRSSDEDHEFDHERPYCSIQETFVSPMRADVCNDRFDFHHAADCDVYRKAGVARAVEEAPAPDDAASPTVAGEIDTTPAVDGVVDAESRGGERDESVRD